jgi:hypothetical protein
LVFRRIIVLCFVSLITAQAYISHMLGHVVLCDAFPSPNPYLWIRSKSSNVDLACGHGTIGINLDVYGPAKESMVRYELCRPTHNFYRNLPRLPQMALDAFDLTFVC